MRIHYLVCFDISDNKVRNQVCKLLLRHGNRVQESVFELALATPGELERLKAELSRQLEDENELRFYRLCRDCRKASHRIDGMQLAAFPAMLVI